MSLRLVFVCAGCVLSIVVGSVSVHEFDDASCPQAPFSIGKICSARNFRDMILAGYENERERAIVSRALNRNTGWHGSFNRHLQSAAHLPECRVVESLRLILSTSYKGAVSFLAETLKTLAEAPVPSGWEGSVDRIPVVAAFLRNLVALHLKLESLYNAAKGLSSDVHGLAEGSTSSLTTIIVEKREKQAKLAGYKQRAETLKNVAKERYFRCGSPGEEICAHPNMLSHGEREELDRLLSLVTTTRAQMEELNRRHHRIKHLICWIAKMIGQARRLYQHTSTVFGQSASLQDIVDNLVALDLVVDPLEQMGDEITSFLATEPTVDVHWGTNIFDTIRTSIRTLKVKLSKYPL